MEIAILFVLLLTTYHLTLPADSLINKGCSGQEPPRVVSVRETDPVGTQLYRATVKPGHSFSVYFNMRFESENDLSPFYNKSLRIDPPNGNNTRKCTNGANSSADSFCDLKLDVIMDPEYIKAEYRSPLESNHQTSFRVLYLIECTVDTENVDSDVWNIILEVRLVNEFSPEFTIPLVKVDKLQSALVTGTQLYNLKDKVTDNDVGHDGEILEMYYAVFTPTDLIEIDGPWVVMARDITWDDVKDGNILRFVITAADATSDTKTGAHVGYKTGNMTLVLSVQGVRQESLRGAAAEKGSGRSSLYICTSVSVLLVLWR